MVAQFTKALRRRSAARRRAHDTLSTPDGNAIPIWQSEATDPVAHLAVVFDQLPGRRRSLKGKHRVS
ncbi:MAG: hypothetical protein NTV23_09525 [Propionibacteriales bacterium]|nr:hypothetical protein [Propionibacteriales bacterium]